jgi:hypothetical protein
MPLGLNLRNTGDAAAEAPASGGPTQFEYLLLTEDGASTIESLTYRKKELARAGGLVPRLVPKVQPLPPGGVLLYSDDLATLTLHPIAPGKYQLEAIYRLPGNVLVRSNRVPIEVIASRPSATVQGIDSPGAKLNAFEFHREDDEQVTLRKWESSAKDPLQGSFQHLHSIRDPVGNVAMALDAEPHDSEIGQWRWVAWTSGDQVHAEVARAIDIKYPTAFLATDLSSVTLFEYGYQYTDGDGLFLLTGIGSEGQRKIRLMKVLADDELPPEFLDVPLPVVPGTLARSTFYSKPADPEDPESRPAHELNLSWVLQAGGGHIFAMTRVDPATGALMAPPRPLFRTNRSLVADSIPPVVIDGVSDSFVFLLAPAEEGSAVTRVALDVRDAARSEEWDLPALDGPSTVQRWILPFSHAAEAPVAAVADHRLWVLSPQSRSWRDTGLDVRNAASAIRLWNLAGDQFWCTWFDTALGFRLHRVA